RSPLDIEAPPPLDLAQLSGALAFDVVAGDAEYVADLLVEYELGMLAVDHRTDRQLRLHRRADLAHDHEIQRRAERRGHLESHGNAAARQRQHAGPAILESEQLGGKSSSGIRAIAKHGDPTADPEGRDGLRTSRGQAR